MPGRRRLPTLRLGAVLLALAAALACGGDAPEVRSVRGQVARVADAGRSLVVDHEEIPDFMEAMRMTFPVQDPSRVRGFAAGDKIRFDLHVSGGRTSIGAIEKLPPDTELALVEPTE
jgi:protein SCO1/2